MILVLVSWISFGILLLNTFVLFTFWLDKNSLWFLGFTNVMDNNLSKINHDTLSNMDDHYRQKLLNMTPLVALNPLTQLWHPYQIWYHYQLQIYQQLQRDVHTKYGNTTGFESTKYDTHAKYDTTSDFESDNSSTHTKFNFWN